MKANHANNTSVYTATTQQTQRICVTFMKCRINVEDVGPTLYKNYTNVLCLLRSALLESITILENFDIFGIIHPKLRLVLERDEESETRQICQGHDVAHFFL